MYLLRNAHACEMESDKIIGYMSARHYVSVGHVVCMCVCVVFACEYVGRVGKNVRLIFVYIFSAACVVCVLVHLLQLPVCDLHTALSCIFITSIYISCCFHAINHIVFELCADRVLVGLFFFFCSMMCIF